jgi:predicted Zn finger-like uncharacterized protein
MRVTCESCGATYNLPDAKVRGRKAKVRCKRCSGTIVVDGTNLDPSAPSHDGDFPEGGEDDEATQIIQSPLAAMGGRGAGAPGTWTVNLSDEDQRQMTSQQLVDGWLSGDVGAEAFVWQDGMDDWLAVMDVPELATAIRSAQTKPAVTAAPRGAGLSPQGVGLAAAPSSQRGPNLHAVTTAKARPATFDLFGPPRSLERDSQPHNPAPAHPGAGYGGGHQAAGQQAPVANENSVMFSLEALKAAAGKTESRPVDSRASEDLLTLGGYDPMGSPLSAPLIEVVPTRPPPADPSARPMSMGPVSAYAPAAIPAKKTSVWVWVGAAVAVLGVGFFGGRMLTGAGALPSSTEGAAASALAASAQADKLKAEEEKKAQEAKAEADKKAEEEKKAQEAKAEADKAIGAKVGSGSSGTGSSGTGAGSGSGSSGSGSSGSGSSGSGSKGTDKPSGGGKAFDVGAAKSALSSAASQAASACKAGGGPTGSGKVQVTFAPSGRVTSARVVSGPFGGTSVGGCVARTFRGAKIPSFDGDPTTVSKSFTIN